MRDSYHNIAVTQLLNPQVSLGTKTSTGIDLQGTNGAMFLFAIGTCADTLSGSLYWTLKMQHSDDNSTYVDCALTDLNNSALTVVVDSTAKDKMTYPFGYVGAKRYIRGVATATGSHASGTPIGMVALSTHANYKPVV